MQAVAHRRRQRGRQWLDRVFQDAHTVAASVRLFFQQAGALECPLFERELRGGAQLRLEFLEAREGLQEEFMHAGAAVRVF